MVAPTQADLPRYDLDVILGIGVATPQPTRVPNAAPTDLHTARIISAVPAEVADKNAPQPSRRDLFIEHSIDLVEKAMAIILVLGTLYAGAIAARKKLTHTNKEWDDDRNDAPPGQRTSISLKKADFDPSAARFWLNPMER